jgi:hypothetical protein
VIDNRQTFRSQGVSRMLSVSKGLFVFRYVSSQAGLNGPIAIVSALPNSGVEIFSADETGEVTLGGPSDAIVVRAAYDSRILVRAVPSVPDGSTHAHFEFERLAQSAPATPAFMPDARTAVLPASMIRSPAILAHVSRRGDVDFLPEEWICGPQFPMVIEGLQLNWSGRPADVDIMVACTTGGRMPRVQPPVGTGSFAGTRGKALPIIGVSLSLVGANANAYSISVDALFLGSEVQSERGTRLAFSGPSGIEPLVGLRLSVEPAAMAGFSANSTFVRQASQPISIRAPQPLRDHAPREAEAPQVHPYAWPVSHTPPQEARRPDAVSSLSAPSVPKAGKVRVFQASRGSPVS